MTNKCLFIFFIGLAMNSNAQDVEVKVKELSEKEQKVIQGLMETSELSSEEIETIKRYAGLTVNHFISNGKPSFDYSSNSVKFMSEVIDTEGQAYPDKNKNNLTTFWGSYYGEAILKEYKGQWLKTNDGQYVVKLENGMYVFPFTRLSNHFFEGSESAIFAQYLSLDNIREVENQIRP